MLKKLVSGTENRRRLTARFSVAIAAGLAFCLATPAATRADRIDEALIGHAPEITAYLIKHQCKNVGVLPFRLQKGDKLPQFRGGMIVDNMCDRLQNALIFAANPEAPRIGIVDHAAALAAKKLRGASYRTPADRQKLFSIKYPLMWGDPPEHVTPDMFLTGKVSASADFRTTTIMIEAFDRAHPSAKLAQVVQFSVKTDRYILADLGQGYSVTKARLLATARGVPAPGDIIEGSDPPPPPLNLSQGNAGAGEAGDITPEPKVEDGNPAAANGADSASGEQQVMHVGEGSPGPFPLEWTVYYDGVAQTPAADPNAPGDRNFAIPDPKPGQKVTFGVKNTGDSTIGLVLTVNGISTLYEERLQADQMQPWILEPGKQFMIKGFHQKDGHTYTPIIGFRDEDTKTVAADLGTGEAVGLIEMFLVKAGSPSAPAVAMSRSMRRPSPQILPGDRAKSIADLQRGLARSANLRAKRGLMAWGSGQESEEIHYQEFYSGPPIGHLVVRYYTVPK